MSSGEGEGPEMQAVVAVVELMEAAMGDAGMTDREWCGFCRFLFGFFCGFFRFLSVAWDFGWL